MEGKPISNPEDKRKIKSALESIKDSYYRISAERENVKEIIKATSEQFNIPKKIFAKMAKTYYQESFDQQCAEASDFETYYESVVGTSND